MKTFPFNPSDVNIHLGIVGSFLPGFKEDGTAAHNIVLTAQANGNRWPQSFTEEDFKQQVKTNWFTHKEYFLDGLTELVEAGCLEYDGTTKTYSFTDKFFECLKPFKYA